eukprot:32915_5
MHRHDPGYRIFILVNTVIYSQPREPCLNVLPRLWALDLYGKAQYLLTELLHKLTSRLQTIQQQHLSCVLTSFGWSDIYCSISELSAEKCPAQVVAFHTKPWVNCRHQHPHCTERYRWEAAERRIYTRNLSGSHNSQPSLPFLKALNTINYFILPLEEHLSVQHLTPALNFIHFCLRYYHPHLLINQLLNFIISSLLDLSLFRVCQLPQGPRFIIIQHLLCMSGIIAFALITCLTFMRVRSMHFAVPSFLSSFFIYCKCS